MSNATRSQWLFPKNEAGKVLGWRGTGGGSSPGLENKDFSAAGLSYDNTTSGLAADTVQEAIDELAGGADFVSNRAELKALDTTFTTNAYLTEAGREGQFIWRTGDFSAEIAADPAEGVYVEADAVAAASGAWVRVFDGAINVKWFGAIGDGTTNDTAAFTAAFLMGLSIYVPAGSFAGINIRPLDGVTLFGAGREVSVLKKTGTGGHIVNITDTDDVSIYGLGFDGTGSDGGHCVAINGSRGISVANCAMRNAVLSGIYVNENAGTPSEGISLSGNLIEDCGSRAIDALAEGLQIERNIARRSADANIVYGGKRVLVSGNLCEDAVAGGNLSGYDAANEDMTIVGNVSVNSGNNGMHVGGSRVIIANNIVRNPAEHGILLAADPNLTPTQCFDGVISGNIVEGLASNVPGIKVINVDRLSIANNSVDGQAVTLASGIEVDGCQNFAINGNNVSEVGLYGILAYRSQGGSIVGNTVADAAQDGIRAGDDGVTATEKVHISGNVVRSCGQSIRALSLSTIDLGQNLCIENANNDPTTITNNDFWYHIPGAIPQWQAFGPATDVNGVIRGKGAGAVIIGGTAGNESFRVAAGVAGGNAIIAEGAASTGHPQFRAFGAGANIDLTLVPKGTGNVRFGTFTSNADAAVNGYITIKDAGGTVRKLATIA